MALRPRVDHKLRLEEVDLQPGGATISVTAPADNPYEDDGAVQVFTQASGGMSEADPHQSSRRRRGGLRRGRVIHQGRTASITANLPAIPGLGADPVPAATGATGALQQLLNAGLQVGTQLATAKAQQKVTAAQTKLATAEAQTAAANAQQAGFMAKVAGQKYLIIGGVVAAAALTAFLMLRKKRK
jgi:hypothetical protein